MTRSLDARPALPPPAGVPGGPPGPPRQPRPGPPRLPAGRVVAGRLRAAMPAVLVTLAALGAWWLATDVVGAGNPLLSGFAPQRAVPAIGTLAREGVLADDIRASMERLLLGLLIAVLAGVPLGLLTGASGTADRATRPLFQFLRMISPLSWAPVAVGVFGIGDRPVVFLVAAAAVWPVVLNTAHGVRSVDPGHLLVARSLGAGRTEVLGSVILPAVRGPALTGIRLALGIGWIVLVPAEMLGVDSGLGYEILNSRDQLAYDQIMALILVIGVLGYLLDALARLVLAPGGRSRGNR